MKRVVLITLFAVMIGSSAAHAQGSGQVVGTQCWINGKLVGGFPAGYTCPGTGGGSTSGSGYSGTYAPLQQAVQQATTNFITWLFSSGSDPQAELQKQEMMLELQRRQAEAERLHRAEEAQQLAAMYNRLNATLKLTGLPNLQLKETSSNGLGLRLKLGDSANGQAGITGIKGLPGIYLNDGKVPYGIPGLPGIYTGGPGQGSGLTNSKLALKTGESEAGVAQVANPAIGSNQSGQYSAVAATSALTNKSGLQLKTGNTDIVSSSQPSTLDPSKMTPQQLADVAVMVSKLPPEEQQRLLTTAQNNATAGQLVPGSTGQRSVLIPLQQQAGASKAAAAAPVMEDASAKARAGFDSALPPYNSTAPSLGSGSRSSATPVPLNTRSEQTAAVSKTLFDKPKLSSTSGSSTTSGLGLKNVTTSAAVTQDQLKDSAKNDLSVNCEKANSTRKDLIKGLPVMADAINRTELQLKGAGEDISKAKVEMNLALMEAALKEVKDYVREFLRTTEALRSQVEAFANMDPKIRDNLIRSLQGLQKHGDMIEALTRSADKAYKERHAIQKELSYLLNLILHTEKLLVESGVAAEIGDSLAHSFGPVGVYGFRISKLSIDWGTAFEQGRLSKKEYQQAKKKLELMREQYLRAQAKITAIEAVMGRDCKSVSRR